MNDDTNMFRIAGIITELKKELDTPENILNFACTICCIVQARSESVLYFFESLLHTVNLNREEKRTSICHAKLLCQNTLRKLEAGEEKKVKGN